MSSPERFAVASAYWQFYVDWHSSGLTDRCRRQGRGIAEQLHRMRFRASPLQSSAENLDECAREVYDRLVAEYHPAYAQAEAHNGHQGGADDEGNP